MVGESIRTMPFARLTFQMTEETGNMGMLGLIGFSHHYTKMHGQHFGILLKVYQQEIDDENINSEMVRYDTEYLDDNGEKAYFPMEKGICLLLVFLGEKNIPFTTYRKWADDYKPLLPWSSNWDSFTPYSDLVGMTFSFKYKGEEIPAKYRPHADEWACKIFE